MQAQKFIEMLLTPTKTKPTNTKMVGIGNACTPSKLTKSKSLYFNNPKIVPQTSHETQLNTQTQITLSLNANMTFMPHQVPL
jgi:hypothetical protein